MVTQADSLTARAQAGSHDRGRYTGFGGQYINGSWRPGRRGRILKDNDAYTGEPVAEIELADRSDLDEAYEAAARNQPRWAAKLPAERAATMLRSAEIMQHRPESTTLVPFRCHLYSIFDKTWRWMGRKLCEASSGDPEWSIYPQRRQGLRSSIS